MVVKMKITEYPVKNLTNDDDIYLLSSGGNVNTIKHKTLFKDTRDNFEAVRLSIDDLKRKNEEANAAINDLRDISNGVVEGNDDVLKTIEDLKTEDQALKNDLNTAKESFSTLISENTQAITLLGAESDSNKAEILRLGGEIKAYSQLTNTALEELGNSIDANQSRIASVENRVTSLESVGSSSSGVRFENFNWADSEGTIDLLSTSLKTITSLNYLRPEISSTNGRCIFVSFSFDLYLKNNTGPSNDYIEKVSSKSYLIPFSRPSIGDTVFKLNREINIKIDFYPHVWALLSVYDVGSNGQIKFELIDADTTQIVTQGSNSILKAELEINPESVYQIFI